MLSPRFGCSEAKMRVEWTEEMQTQAIAFYLTNYIDSFSTADADLAAAQIPQLSNVY
jgi:hypothetical protein